MPSRFLNNITVNDKYTLPSADGTENQIIVTDGAGNLSFDDLSTVTGKVEGVEADIIYYEVKNSTGATIDAFKGVMAVGTDGNSGHVLIDEMVADGSVEARYFLGITRDPILNGDIGRVIAFGEIDQVNTNAFPDGTILWCDPTSPGNFTATEPDGPNLKIPAAFVLNQATNGKIQVRVQVNEGIKDLYDTKITSQVDGDVLVWDNTTGVWFNDSTLNVDYAAGNVGIGTTSPSTKLHISDATTPEVRIQDTTNNRYLSLYQNDSNSYIQTSLNSPLVFSTHGSNERMRITTSGNVGIGTTNPARKLEVYNGSSSMVSQFRSGSGTSSFICFANTESTADQVRIGSISTNLVLSTNYTERMRIDSSGNVGIGTTSPQEKLHIYSTGAGAVRAEIESTQATDAILKYTNSIGSYATFLTQSGQFSIYDYNAASHRFYMLTNGNIGIGTTNPGAKLDVVQSTVANGLPALHLIGPNTNSGLTSSVLIIEQGDGKKITIDGNDIDVSSGDLFINDYSKEDVTFGGQIKVTGGGVGGDSYFANGSVGIGTTIPGAKLDVIGDANIGDLHTNFGGASFNVNLGFQNYNNGFAAIATGQGTLADANHSFSMGYQSKATGIASLAGGNVSTVTALPSEAAGEASLAFGNGVKTNANANFSQAFGRQTTTGGGSTSANQAMAIGYDSTAWADNSFSGGNTSNSFGEASFAFGEGATASKGDGNIALGIGVTTPTGATDAYGVGQVAVGKYNVYNTAGVSHVFAVGAGTSDASRYNAFNVTSTGRIGINGITNPSSILHAKLNNYATGFWMEGPANTTSFNYMAFYSGTTFKGSINPTVSGVSYGSASDYRLKENVTKLNNSTERVKKLKPSNFNFLENANETVDGFIAHEVQEIVPEAVTGKKDEVGPDGKPIYQSVDNSKIVPLLTAALQEAISKIEQLETRIQTLENK